MNHDSIILRAKRDIVAAHQQPAPDAVLRRTINQLNNIGIFDLKTIEDVYNRRLEAAAQAMRRAA